MSCVAGGTAGGFPSQLQVPFAFAHLGCGASKCSSPPPGCIHRRRRIFRIFRVVYGHRRSHRSESQQGDHDTGHDPSEHPGERPRVDRGVRLRSEPKGATFDQWRARRGTRSRCVFSTGIWSPMWCTHHLEVEKPLLVESSLPRDQASHFHVMCSSECKLTHQVAPHLGTSSKIKATLKGKTDQPCSSHARGKHLAPVQPPCEAAT